MTLEKLKDLMVHQLAGFVPRDERDTATEDTVFKNVLGDGTGSQDPCTVYKQLVQLACRMLDVTLKAWPVGWPTLTTATLAPKLLPEEPKPAGGG